MNNKLKLQLQQKNMNKYDVLGIVGEGAYGYVYKAKNKETGQYGTVVVSLTLFNNLNSSQSYVELSKFMNKTSSFKLSFGILVQRKCARNPHLQFYTELGDIVQNL